MGHALAFFLLVAAAIGAPAPGSGTLVNASAGSTNHILEARIEVDLIDFVEAATRLGSVYLEDFVHSLAAIALAR
jgi:hypothetical protein